MRALKLLKASLSGWSARCIIVALVLCASAAAQTQSEDPPSRVGRLSESNGDVFIAPDDPNTDWQPVSLNYPVTIGDNIWSGQDGRAEIDFGAGHVRLSRDTNIHFSQLDDRQFSAYLASGRAILRLRSLESGDAAKFDTANVQIDIVRPGIYRIEADADGLVSQVVVRDGEVQLRTADSAATLFGGQVATINGSGPGSSIVVREGYGTDGFDAWSSDRDRRYEGASLSTQYVSTYVPGVRDLDYYGSWETVPTYGPVWYPTSVSADWVPYRDGSWAYVQPWGWTWVDRAPWGWAPFHYGRWVRIGPRWAWCPGEFVRRPVYSPALVAWYGGPSGTNWSVSFGGPTLGWVPLSWGEPYSPHYRHSTNYWRLVNRPYAVNVTRVPSKPLEVGYANARVPGALTAVSADVFTRRASVAANHRPVPVGALTGSAVTTTALAIRPLARPIAEVTRPRGAPAPAGAFVGRSPAERSDLNAPGAGRVYTGRPRISTEPAPYWRPGMSPSTPNPRPTIVEPMPGFARPGAAAPPPTPPQAITEQPSPRSRSIAPNPAPVTSAPMQLPGQVYAPGQSTAPPPAYAAPQRPNPSLRSPFTESAPPMQQRPNVREPSMQRTPMPAPGQALVPAPQQHAPAPQYVPAPMPPSAPVAREPVPVAPTPGATSQVQRPGMPNPPGRTEPQPTLPSTGQLPR
jgi:hypothetical protein